MLDKAVSYAENHGIIEYHTQGSYMVYYTSFPTERTTYKAIVNLENETEKRTPLKNYYKAYSAKIGGLYQSNYMA